MIGQRVVLRYGIVEILPIIPPHFNEDRARCRDKSRVFVAVKAYTNYVQNWNPPICCVHISEASMSVCKLRFNFLYILILVLKPVVGVITINPCIIVSTTESGL